MSLQQHTSKKYEAELEELRTRVLTMGGQVEQQVRLSVEAYVGGDTRAAQAILVTEQEINHEHVAIDHFCSEIIARRQPAAKDLRLLLGVIRTISDLERIADQAAKIAKLTLRRDQHGELGKLLPRVPTIALSAQLAVDMLRGALDAFARENSDQARSIMLMDSQLDEQYDASMRQLITYMIEDPRTISVALDAIWVAKAIERMGDHVENLAEVAIYIVEGEDVRYHHDALGTNNSED